MKPFSPLYFIKENRMRSVLLIFMMMLEYGIYLTGLYLGNSLDNWKYSLKNFEKTAVVYAVETDENLNDYNKLVEEVINNERIKVIYSGKSQQIDYNTIMGYKSGCISYTFRSVSDFKTYCNYFNIKCDFSSLKSGSMIMSKKYADNIGIRYGDTIRKDDEMRLTRDFRLDAVTDEDGYPIYFITDEDEESRGLILLGDNVHEYTEQLKQKYNVYIVNDMKSGMKQDYVPFKIIFYSIVFLFSVIMAIIINSAYIGMYQNRKPEFAVYRAIGISKVKTMFKIISELLCMDAAALISGAVVIFLFVYLFNNLYLYDKGLYLQYFNSTAISGTAISNLLIIIPLSVSRSAMAAKADICEI